MPPTETDGVDPEPIRCNAHAELDWSTAPERPLSIHVEIPPGLVEDVQDVTETVEISASVADE